MESSTPVITLCQVRLHRSRETLPVTPQKPAPIPWGQGSRARTGGSLQDLEWPPARTWEKSKQPSHTTSRRQNPPEPAARKRPQSEGAPAPADT